MADKDMAAEIWNTLSKIDVSEHTEVKSVNGKDLTYLSWAWAWGVLMKHYPDADYEILDDQYIENSVVREKQGQNWVTNTGRTVMVGVRMDIRGVERYMWLPVMNAKNNAQVDPCARSISDARMRCLVKVLALYGLGHYIYAGEDVPQADDESPADSGSKKAKTTTNKKESSTVEGVSATETEHARVTRETMSVFVAECNSVEALENFWLSNKEHLHRVKRECPAVFDGLVATFKAAKERLTAK